MIKEYAPLNLILEKLNSIGLTESAKQVPYITDEPKIPCFTCFPKRGLEERGFYINDYGQGFDPDKTLAEIKSLGECLERLCLFNPIEENLIRTVSRDKTIDPALFCVYSEEQVNREEFISKLINEKYIFTKVRNLTNNSEIFIPSQLIYLSSQFDSEISIRGERISTGAACGLIGSNHALMGGFFEVVERDSWISSYLTQRGVKRIINLPEDLEKFVDYLNRYELETHIFDITSDLKIPSVTCITLDKTGIGDAVNIGAKADANYHDAINGAILESIQSRRGSRIHRHEYPNAEKEIDLKKIKTSEERHLYCRPLERIDDLKSLLENSDKIDYNILIKGDTSFESAFKNVIGRGYHIFVADITLPKIKESGFEVLKVLIPELHPLYLSEDAKALYSVHYGSINNNPELKPHMFT